MHRNGETMIKPTIHLNGSSKDDLFDKYMTALAAVEAAIDALAQAGPHGRDYYPQGDDAFREARAEHEARLRQLNNVSRELMILADHTK
jgi:hypothetical protein